MKYKVITSLVGLFLFFAAHSQQNSLDAKSMARKFAATYDIYQLPYPRVEFEKRKDSWYVKTISFSGNKAVRSGPMLFYDGKKNMFVDLKLPKGPTHVDDIEDIIYEYEIYNFDLQPYYGYEGWYKDVIREYRTLPKLTDKELFGLARAYSRQAIEPVTGQGGYASPEDVYKLALGPNAFSAVQTKEVITYMDSALEKYRELAVRSPYFETRVGDIRDTYANEIMYKYYILLTHSQKDAKAMVIPNNIYKDSTLRLPRAYLNACPQQSIFVSFGDNDYYPMLYLQLAEGLRKDVYVINYSLLGVDRFIYHITMSQFDARPIKLSVDTTMYAGEVNDLIYLHDSTNSITASELINFIRTDKGDELGRKILEVGTIEMPLKRAGRYNTTARVSMEDNNYLFKNLWVLIDMINNLEGRVLCFPDKIQGQLRGLNEYLTPVKAKLLYLYNN